MRFGPIRKPLSVPCSAPFWLHENVRVDKRSMRSSGLFLSRFCHVRDIYLQNLCGIFNENIFLPKSKSLAGPFTSTSRARNALCGSYIDAKVLREAGDARRAYKQNHEQETPDFFCHFLWCRVPQVATGNLFFLMVFFTPHDIFLGPAVLS